MSFLTDTTQTESYTILLDSNSAADGHYTFRLDIPVGQIQRYCWWDGSAWHAGYTDVWHQQGRIYEWVGNYKGSCHWEYNGDCGYFRSAWNMTTRGGGTRYWSGAVNASPPDYYVDRFGFQCVFEDDYRFRNQTENAGNGSIYWAYIPCELRLGSSAGPVIWSNSYNWYNPWGSWNIDFTVSEDDVCNYMNRFAVISETSIDDGVNVWNNQISIYMNCRLIQWFDPANQGDLASRGYNPIQNREDHRTYAMSPIYFKPRRMTVSLTKTLHYDHEVNNDTSWNPYNTNSIYYTYTAKVYIPVLNWYNTTQPQYTYTVTTPVYKKYKSAGFGGKFIVNGYIAPTLPTGNYVDMAVSGTSWFRIPTTTGTQYSLTKPTTQYSYTYNESTDVATWTCNVDASAMSNLPGQGFNYTIQVIGYETHDGTTTKIFDSTIISNGHGKYNYTGTVSGINANDITSTVQFNTYIMYGTLQTNLSSAFTKSVYTSYNIMYWSPTLDGLGLYAPPDDNHLLEVPILNITCNPDNIQAADPDTYTEFPHKNRTLNTNPHWMVVAAGWYNPTGQGGNANRSFISMYVLPHTDCDGKAKVWICQHYFYERRSMLPKYYARTNYPLKIGTNETMTPANNTIYCIDTVLNSFYTSNTAAGYHYMHGVRNYYTDGYVKIHNATGIAHYYIPIFYNGSFVYVDEDDLKPTSV